MIAIIIPYYKKTYFRQTLQSLANQTDKRFHVYIGDDGSPEDPKDLIKEFQEDFRITYKKFEENLGSKSLVQQWERCIEIIRNEEWLTILGDDDAYNYDVVEKFYNSLREIKKENTNVVRFATYVINENNEVIGSLHRHPEKEKAVDFLIRKFNGRARSTLSEYFFKSEIVRKVKFKDFPLAWSSDTLAVVEFSDDKNILTINDTFVLFRISKENITGQGDSIEKNASWFKFYYQLLSNYGKHYPKQLVNTLFDRLEKVQLNNKKTPVRWVKLIGLYCYYFKYSRFLSISRKIRNSIR